MSTETTDLTPSEGQDLFGPKPVQAVLVDKAAAARSVAAARVIMPNRNQIELRPMDLESRRRWEAYTKAKEIMLERTHISEAPWWVVQADDKKKARLNCISHQLAQMP